MLRFLIHSAILKNHRTDTRSTEYYSEFKENKFKRRKCNQSKEIDVERDAQINFLISIVENTRMTTYVSFVVEFPSLLLVIKHLH